MPILLSWFVRFHAEISGGLSGADVLLGDMAALFEERLIRDLFPYRQRKGTQLLAGVFPESLPAKLQSASQSARLAQQIFPLCFHCHEPATVRQNSGRGQHF